MVNPPMDFPQSESNNLFNCRFASWKSNTPAVFKNPTASGYYKYITWLRVFVGSNANRGKELHWHFKLTVFILLTVDNTNTTSLISAEYLALSTFCKGNYKNSVASFVL